MAENSDYGVLKEGEMYSGFVVDKTLNIKELQCDMIELIHQPSGARIVNLANDDDENVFCLSFQTIPQSSDGVAHILEHTVLCGSEKFPVKDPFFSMNRRSLNTYMNAMTGSDFTCYPAASQVEKDFYNLLDVYLDAVFHPKLEEFSFLQEGHRLDFDDNDNLQYKGIVFNEMKGSFTVPDTRLWNTMMRGLFPDITYGYVSGGDPKIIPKLTYQELVEFHRRYYHPSRCVFFFYGNIPVQKHLDFIVDHVLDGVEPLDHLEPIPKQQRFLEPRRLTCSYPVADNEDSTEKYWLSMGWLTCSVLDQQEILALLVLEIILMGTDAALLKLPLLKSRMCKQAVAYVEPDISEIPVILIMKGCKKDDIEPLRELVVETLNNVAKGEIPQDLIDSAIHQLEFSRCEITGDGMPFGLSLFMRSVLLKQHGGLCEDGLQIHTLFAELRERCAEPGYLTGLIEKYMLGNRHEVTVVLEPDPALAGDEAKEEKGVLEAIKEGLDANEKQHIIEQAKGLEEFQDEQEKEDIDVLPKVTIADVPVNPRNIILTEDKIDNVKIFHHECFTNNIVYVDLIFDLPNLKESELSLVRLFGNMLTQVGCGGRNYKDNLEYIQKYTGGVGSVLSLHKKAYAAGEFEPTIGLWGKALSRNSDKLAVLLLELATTVDFNDPQRLKELLLKHYNGLEQSLTYSALRYAINLSASGLSQTGHIANHWSGLAYFQAVRSIVEDIDNKIGWLIDVFHDFRDRLLCAGESHIIITCDQDHYGKWLNNGLYGLSTFESKPLDLWKGGYELQLVLSQGRVIPAGVSFTSKIFGNVHYDHPDAPMLSVAAMLFDNKTIHKRIREQGGAYGCGAVNNILSGNFYFYTYRDPNIASSLNAFDEAVNRIVNNNYTEEDIEEAKLGVVQGFDAPISPGSRGITAYNWMREGRTIERRQKFRDKLLSLKREDIKRAVEEHIVPRLAEGTVVSFASREILEQENASLKEPLKVYDI